jgi:hypothetical protein
MQESHGLLTVPLTVRVTYPTLPKVPVLAVELIWYTVDDMPASLTTVELQLTVTLKLIPGKVTPPFVQALALTAR